jgi:hypothetical protein
MLHSWLALTFQAARLTWEAQGAIALRLIELADGGGAAQSKAMSAERVATSAEAQPVAATTAVATTAVPKDRNGASAGEKVSNTPKKKVRATKRKAFEVTSSLRQPALASHWTRWFTARIC